MHICDHHCAEDRVHEKEAAFRAYFAQRAAEGYDTEPSAEALALLEATR